MSLSRLINNRYQILSEIGAGGMGTVYRALDRLSQQRVALKRLNIPVEFFPFISDSGSGGDVLLNLAHEFETLASLRHPHIISVLDYGFDDEKNPYLIMELLENAEPITHYAHGKSEADIIPRLIELLQALNYLHRRGIIHRDIKPDNVLIASHSVRILDFGLASAVDSQPEISGTIGYIAPEILKGQSAGIASDLYAAGVLIYQIFSGELPFYNPDFDTMVKAVVSQKPTVSHLNISAELQTITGKLLAKNPADRYSSALEVIQSLATATGTPVQSSPAIQESYIQAAQFVGREAELATLQTALTQAQSSQGSLWLISGESGVGKSRLADELRIRALVKGVQVLRGQAVAEGGQPYQLWRSIIRHLILTTELSDLEAGILREIVPDIDTLLNRKIPAIPEMEGHAGQKRLQFMILAVLRRQKQPLLLILEDLHWTIESLKPLSQLAPVINHLPLLAICTFRDEERPMLIKELQDAYQLPLARLDAAAIRTLSTSILGHGGARPEVIALLQQETEGNVLFLVEVVRALAESAGGLEDIGQMTLPRRVFAGGVQEVLRRRLEKIPAADRPLLELAAIAGRQLDLALLEQLKGDIVLDSWLVTCQDAAVLEVQEDIWRFTHDKLRETLMNSIPPAQLPARYHRVATALEAAHPDAPGYDEMLLEYWHRANEPERELQYLLRVSDYLVKTAADYDRARRILERGLRYLTPDDPRRIKLLNLLALACTRQSDFDAALPPAREAQALAEKLNDQRGLANSLTEQGMVDLRQGRYPDAEQRFQQCLDIYKKLDHQNGVAQSLNNLGILTYYQGDYAGAQVFYEQAIAIYRQQDNLNGIASTLNNLGIVTYFQGDYAATQTCYQESLAIKEKLGDQHGIANSLNNLGSIAYFRKQYDEAQDYLQRSLALKKPIGDQQGIAGTLTMLGFVSLRLNATGQAQSAFHEALSIARRTRKTRVALEILMGFAELYVHQENPARAAELVSMAKAHPAWNSETEMHVDELMPGIEASLSAEALAAALEHGQSLDVDETIMAVLAEFETASKEQGIR